MQKDGGSLIAEVLVEEGVRALFTLCGGHISPILVESKRRGIQVVDMRDEKNAVFAADANARITGNVGVAAVTAGPGVTNAITAIKNAQMAQSPVIVFGGSTATILKGRGSLQDIDQLSLVASCTKWSKSIRTLSALAPSVRKAFAIARQGVPGPVFIEVPVDLLYSEAIIREMFKKELGGGGGSLAGKALELFMKGYLYRQFNQPHIELPVPELPDLSLRSQRDRIWQAANLLESAERPVVVIGSQAVTLRPPESLADAVTAVGAPTFLGGMARGLLGARSPIQFRHNRGRALKEADVVVVLGFPFDFRLKYGRAIGQKATIIAANLNADELKTNRRADIGIEMHAGECFEAFSVLVKPEPARWQPWIEKLRAGEEARDKEIAGMAQSNGSKDSDGVSPLELLLEVEKRIADDSMIVVDGGDFAASAAYILRPRGPLRWLDPGVFGTLGVGGGFVTGAAAARPNSQIWLIYGDGSSAYSLAEFDTYKRHGMHPIAVVGTDALWAQIAREQGEMLGDDVGTRLLKTDYQVVAEGYGGKGLLIKTPAEIPSVLDQAVKLSAAGHAVCVNVHLASTDFRKGSMSM
jgi:acetolactate synthase-1/2/3 large subunit